jgi:fructokinase
LLSWIEPDAKKKHEQTLLIFNLKNIKQVGEDEFGYMLANILKENSVNSSGLRFDPGARTALAFVTLRSDGEREFMFYRNPSADMLLKEEELDLDLIKKVHLSPVLPFFSFSLTTIVI